MSSPSAIVCLPVLLCALLTAGCDRKAEAPGQAAAAPANVAAASPDEAPPAAATPPGGAVDRSHRGEAMPAAALTDLDGKAVALPVGRPVLVNLWATWCAPCVAELPSLDAAAAGIDAVAINQGEEVGKVRAFLAPRALRHLRPLLDKDMAISLGLSANLPTTILYDADGREVWRVTGGRDWATADSRALIGPAPSAASSGQLAR